MKKSRRPVRTALFLLSFSLLISLLAACGTPGTGATTPAANSTTTGTTATVNKGDNLMAGIQSAGWTATADVPDPATLQGINRFAANLLLSSTANKGNVMVSPLSVFLALAMTANGADGETLATMRQVLAGGEITTDQINAASKALMIRLTNTGSKTSVSIANSIWFRQSFEPYQPFLQTNADFFRAGATRLDFTDETAKDIINGWVEENTHGLIDEIIEKINPTTVMFLINTVYFKSDWQTPFLKEETRQQAFGTPSGEVTADFMHRIDKMSYFTGNGASGVALPYDDGQYAYFALLPDGDATPRQWLAAQDPAVLFSNIAGLMAQKANFTVNLALPKYKAEYEDSLIDELTALGMGVAFNGSSADFSRLNAARAKGLFISEVKHKTFIQVDEKGTEAAAATSVAIDESMPQYDVELVFNRPFLYGIIDRATGTPLFVGILENPAGN
jgi:serine protease inhibitor